ncbi:MAG TPA: nucleotidyltransferase domain-containing protein, partial [Gaiellaceae bacterium]|nr:nucleotidyltransferase domain-containing protein [Gaiellaceae bacterium]
MATARSGELRDLAQRVADALPALVEEVVLTGSVSRGVADDLSDIEMLVVAEDLPGRDECEACSRAVGLEAIALWSRPESADSHLVSGRLGGVAVELVWWSRAYAEERVGAIAAGAIHDDRILTADALVHGLPLRTS